MNDEAAPDANPNNHSDLDPHTSHRTTPSGTSKRVGSRGWLSSVRRPRTSPGPRTSVSSFNKTTLLTNSAIDDTRRDSALATSTTSCDGADSTAPTHATSSSSSPSLHKAPSLPVITVHHEPTPPSSSSRASQHNPSQSGTPSERKLDFQAIDTVIPTGGFDDLTSPTQISFSKRGSMLLGGKRANKMNFNQLSHVAEASSESNQQAETQSDDKEEKHEETNAQAGQQQLSAPCIPRRTARSLSGNSMRRRVVSNRILSTDEAMLSRKVRAMYKHGNESAANWDDLEEEDESVRNGFPGSSVIGTPANTSSLTVTLEDASSLRSSKRGSVIARDTKRDSMIVREPAEVAGGAEDWTDVEGGEVDRYGFIMPKKAPSGGSASQGPDDGPDEPGIQRVTTLLKLASEEPRNRGGIGRSVSRARSGRLAIAKGHARRQSQRSSQVQPSLFSNRTAHTRRTPQKPFRQATNRLPHNRNRRLLDEASDMLKLPPGLAELAEEAEDGKAAQAMKKKEMEREEKWRKMAKVVKEGTKGGGMLFEFDVKDSKVTSRTWKGIPDRWRATAWYSFLAASAKAVEDSPTDEELIESFYELQEESSADDVQIDMDVPRTINRHIMFRRRYRGGQRLLFRVLHAMSLYLPETGYVQGMAPLAATLLCYYEEDKAFVMLVRLWMHRGLEKLYEKGFTGLMEALQDFEQNWMRGRDVAKKLTELDVSPTAYGTRWYLTLFNYSLPFPAQLRVWDVFMLLGDISHASSPSNFSGDLDVLHATSAALIDATKEILLDSDFENAMKVLTSWIPIKDEDLLMKVAKAEYKMRKKRRNAT
ncbi:RabGAP/TBC [Westerdykella ornata]|uniref:RabGAP/TBC n=1 Tax=Westerdykella ornata TaxID=318751 RepID=A0A6A6J7G3_WESOR|nr:RabGAP/TBC [Westerdykella ornata]KAF2272174.1 RabGAP/TBC [Westerdykella ornata]